MELYKLSIIIPCYNAAKYIKNCLNAVYTSGYQLQEQYEVIIINDGSTDETATILTSYKNEGKDIKVIHTENQGVSSARNQGVEKAQGEYIWFIDADDIIEERSISTIIEQLHNTKIDCLLFSFNLIEDNQSKPQQNFVLNNNTEYILSSKIIIKDVIPIMFGYSQTNLERLFQGKTLSETKGFMHGAVWHYIFKRSIIKEHKILFRQDISLNEDTMFTLKYLCYTQKMKVISDCLYNYYLRPSGSMSKILSNPRTLFNNKIRLAEERHLINSYYKQYHHVDLSKYYDGSLFLSAMELGVKLSKDSYKFIQLFKEYSSFPPVRQAIKRIDIKNAPLKYKIPISLLKNRLYHVLYLSIFISHKIGYKIKI